MRRMQGWAASSAWGWVDRRSPSECGSPVHRLGQVRCIRCLDHPVPVFRVAASTVAADTAPSFGFVLDRHRRSGGPGVLGCAPC